MNATQLPQPIAGPAPRTGGLVLAAGAGSRIGHRPKCLMQQDGLSLLERQLRALSHSDVKPVLVVLGHYAERILQEGALARWAAQPVLNPQPDDGHVSSLRIGLGALPAGLDAVVVALADQPTIDAQAIQALLAAYASRPAGMHMLQPTVHGLPGNPVVLSSWVVSHLLAGDAQMGARQWQQAHPAQTYRWNTPDARYRLDVDNEQDRQTLETLTGQSLRWPSDLSR